MKVFTALSRVLYGLVLSIMMTGAAMAHAIVLDAQPAAGASVAGPDVPVAIRFSSRIDKIRSRLILHDVANHKTTLPLADDSPAEVMRSTARGLAAGRYRLDWYALSVDGHITRGVIRFTVKSP